MKEKINDINEYCKKSEEPIIIVGSNVVVAHGNKAQIKTLLTLVIRELLDSSNFSYEDLEQIVKVSKLSAKEIDKIVSKIKKILDK